MKIKTKMLKRLIAVLCAATMVASGAVVSVGAVNESDINAAWQKVEDFDEKITQLKEQKVKIESEKQTLIRNFDEQIEKYDESRQKLIVEIGSTGKSNELGWKRIENSIKESKKLKREVIDKCSAEILNTEAEIKKAEEEKKKLNIQANNLLKQLEKERQQKLEKEKQEKERQQKLEKERLEKERQQKLDKERLERERQQKLEKEKLRKKKKIKIALSPILKKQNIKPKIMQKPRNIEKKELNNINKSDYAKFWEEIEAGSQYDRSGKYENLCWLMSARNVLNYFGLTEKSPKLPVQGVQNVIEEYLKAGGKLDVAKKAVNSKTTGKSKKAVNSKTTGKSKPAFKFNPTMRSDKDILRWLKKNRISTLTVYDESTDVEKLMLLVKEQIVARFYSSSTDIDRMAPIIVGGGSHWKTIVDYNKDTGIVTVVDSLVEGDKGMVFEKNIDDVVRGLITDLGYDGAFRVVLIFTAKKKDVSGPYIQVQPINQEEVDKKIKQVRMDAKNRKSDKDTTDRIINEEKEYLDTLLKNRQTAKEEISKF